MMSIPESVRAVERDLREIFGGRLRSLIAYRGLHTLAIVDALSADDLRACAGRAGAWHGAGVPTPLVVGAHEFERSLDAFPLEFGDILADHVVVAGETPFDGLTVDAADLRRACEVQARSHLLHLREGFIETRGRADALSILIVRSAAPLGALLVAMARLDGASPADEAAAASHAERAIGLDNGILATVVALAGVTEISSEEATRLFPPYLDAATRMVEFVDRWTSR